MKFIIKLFPEITIKSKSVRQRFTKMLQGTFATCCAASTKMPAYGWIGTSW